MTSPYWAGQIEALCDAHDVVAFDLPGHGSSPSKPDNWTLDKAAAVLAQVIRSTGAGRAIYTTNAVHEFPFASKDSVRRLEGRDKIAAYMGQLPRIIHFGKLSDVRVREASDELIIKATGGSRPRP